MTSFRHHKGAGEQGVSRPLDDGVGLTGDEGLVDLNLTGQHGGVGGDLVAGAELRHVVPHQMGCGHRAQVALPHHVGPGGGQQVEFVDGLLGAQLLQDTDAGVGHGDEQEQKVLHRSHKDQQSGQHHKDEVEEGKDVGPHDLPHGLGGGFHRIVGPAVLLALPHLGHGEAQIGVGAHPGHIPARTGDGLGRWMLFLLAFHVVALNTVNSVLRTDNFQNLVTL